MLQRQANQYCIPQFTERFAPLRSTYPMPDYFCTTLILNLISIQYKVLDINIVCGRIPATSRKCYGSAKWDETFHPGCLIDIIMLNILHIAIQWL